MVTSIQLNNTLGHIGDLYISFSFLFITSEKEGWCMPSMATLKSVTVY